MSRFFYSTVLYLALPFVLARLVLRGFRNSDYFRFFGERFGHIRPTLLRPVIWLHAVSVGEVQAALPLLKRLRKDFIGYEIFVTTTTPTGRAHLERHFGHQLRHAYFPYDLPHVVRRYLNRLQPKLVLIMETEIWPNLLHHCRRRGIPTVLVNGRLSEKSARGYRRLGPVARRALQDWSLIAAKSAEDATRFEQVGADATQVRVVGNLKFDVEVDEDSFARVQALRSQLGVGRPVWIAASTRDGEEPQILEAYQKVKQAIEQVLLVLVPRHPERFDKVAELVERADLAYDRRSEKNLCTGNVEVYLVDTMGELRDLYAAADVAFVGGSLVDRGCHNLVEPASLGVPVVFGWSTYNFADVAAELKACGGGEQVADSGRLAETVIKLLSDEALRRKMGVAARQLILANRGATDRFVGVVGELLLRAK